VPLKHKWAPYGILAPALLYNTYQVQLIPPGGVAYFSSHSATKFAFETGGGVRYYVEENWGVRGEYRYTISNLNFSSLLGGVFYQFNGSWPFRFRNGGRGARRVLTGNPTALSRNASRALRVQTE
jgi:hypothetical protein